MHIILPVVSIDNCISMVGGRCVPDKKESLKFSCSLFSISWHLLTPVNWLYISCLFLFILSHYYLSLFSFHCSALTHYTVVIKLFGFFLSELTMEDQLPQDDDQLITEFIEITGASFQEAQSLLQSTNFDLEYAMNLYWEYQKPPPSSNDSM